MEKTRNLLIEVAQDTPAYVTLAVDVPADSTPDQIIEIAKKEAISFVEADEENVQFVPSYDWNGLRIVAITEHTPEGLAYLAEDVAIESSGEDLGLVAKSVLKGLVPPSVLLQEAERQKLSVCPGMKTLLSTPSAQSDDGVQIPEFTPFTLVVESWACDEYGDSPAYAEVAMTPALLAEIARIARIAQDAQIRVAHIDSDDGVWRDPDESLRMRGTDLVIMPSRGSLEESSFFWQGHPKHADYNCETRAIDIKDLLACIGDAETDLPNGFRRERDVLFYDADSCAMDDLISMYFEESDDEEDEAQCTDESAPECPAPWVIYHREEQPEARFWSNEDGWTCLAGATRFAELPHAPYPIGGPKGNQAAALRIGTMQPYTVIVAHAPGETAFAFECFAENAGRAVYQALKVRPCSEVTSVFLTESIEDEEFFA